MKQRKDLLKASKITRNTDEFIPGSDEISVNPGMERRKFLGLMGASFAFAGLMSTGCIRRPVNKIVPATQGVEGRIPGKNTYYASSARIGQSVLGLSVTSSDGRPTKLDGHSSHYFSNPIKDSSFGSSNTWTQAEILKMYDPDRGQSCLKEGKNYDKKSFIKDYQKALGESHKKGGEGLLFVYEDSYSPSFESLVKDFHKNYPKAKLCRLDPTYSENRDKALKSILNETSIAPVYHIDKADIIVSLDADFLGVEGDSVKNSRQFAEGRRLSPARKKMNRLYCLESQYSLTGASSDHRYPLSSKHLPSFILFLCKYLKEMGLDLDARIPNPKQNLADDIKTFAKLLAKDLMAHKGRVLLICGNRQAPFCHELTFYLNSLLNQGNSTQSFYKHDYKTHDYATSFLELEALLNSKSTTTAVFLNTNLAYHARKNSTLKTNIKKLENSFYFAYSPDETASLVNYYAPTTHFLESWGDFCSSNGEVSPCQPLIRPLFDAAFQVYDVLSLAMKLKEGSSKSYDFVKGFWQSRASSKKDLDKDWLSSLSKGLFSKNFAREVSKKPKFLFHNIEEYSGDSNDLTLELYLDTSVYDGSYSNLSWLQELPDPITKLTWDNALFVSPKVAKDLKLDDNSSANAHYAPLVEVTNKDLKLELPVYKLPGLPKDSVVLHLGYGRDFGRVGRGVGFDANSLRTSYEWQFHGVTLKKTTKTYKLAFSQPIPQMTGDGKFSKRPPAVRQASLKTFQENPNFVLKDEILPKKEQKSFLFKYPPDEKDKVAAKEQWGMVIDLTTCTGCHACTTACQAENNISVVGKEDVARGRDMHWIRLDRYFTGDLDNPQVKTSFQPLGCQHCENAPCEAVCPVAATVHSPDGLNQMAYNRCVGTRYCANNCPYRVRRFNFFNYSKDNDEQNPLYAMQKNPNVTVRFRGVMEKCSYCVHRINDARIKAKTSKTDIKDGDVVVACQEACPTQSIVFGNIADPNSKVSQKKRLEQNYLLLNELNTQPRTSYLAKIVNENEDF